MNMQNNSTVSTKYWHAIKDNRIQCDLCPRHCQLQDGQRGFCFVRACEDQQIVLTTYGLSTGLSVDPIEKKPLFHFLPGSKVLSFGTAGCNLGCQFCQNWQMSRSREMQIMSQVATPEQIAQVAQQNGCQSVAFTYNEPTIFMEFAIDVAKACHELGIKTVTVTNGYICPEPRHEFYQHIDAANVDLKAFTDKFYQKLAASHLDPVLDTLKYIHKKTKTWLEVTTLIIPGYNDSDEDLEKEAKWLMKHLGPDVPLHFSAFFPAFKMQNIPGTPMETLLKAQKIAQDAGIQYVYVGNTNNTDGESTFCSKCGKKIIERIRYQISELHVDSQGMCEFCKTPCPGVFS